MTNTPTDTLLPTDGDLVQFGYAPGGYYGKCRGCRCPFIGAKRAWHCKPCAIAAWNHRTTPTPPATDEREAVARVMAASKGLDWDGKHKATEYANHGYWLPAADAALAALAPYRAAEIAAAHERGAAEERAGRGIEIATLITRLDTAERERDRLQRLLRELHDGKRRG